MATYKVTYKGHYFIEADSAEEAMKTSRDDCEVEFEAYENIKAEEIEE